ncbi:ankyrin repeat domain-containing protein [Methylopila sp. M107]|uniref:ankyrin repeat domain-containing protein n=1 Tax=Methylopila sp. M107 TaxID=1101190 RepID=UPI0003A66C5F|nr:ankyrin repeat domain-containing protein [Methylopila sp. M107]
MKQLVYTAILAGATAFAAPTRASDLSVLGETPLNQADFWVRTVTPELIKEQLKAGADLNKLDELGDNAVVWAGNTGASEDVWRLLIKKGADLTGKLKEEREAIFWVTKGGTPDAVRLVMSRPGVNIHLLDSSGRNAFAHATRQQPDLQVFRLLVDAGINIRQKDSNGRTAIHEAAMRTRYVHVLEYLNSVGLQYSELNSFGRDAFLDAAWRNPIYDVVVFLASKSDIRRTDKDGLNAVMLASENNPSGKVFKWLLDQGLKPDGVDANGATALVRSGANSAEVASQLIAMGQDVNAVDNDGNTAFINAGKATVFGPDLYALLDKAGARKQAVNNDGMNALMFALDNNRPDQNGPQNVLLLLKKYKVSPFKKTKDGDTVLTLAAAARQPKQVLHALFSENQQLNVNARGSDGRTPLMHYAAEGYDVEAIQFLLRSGAKTGMKDNEGRTAKDLALANPSLAASPIIGRL